MLRLQVNLKNKNGLKNIGDKVTRVVHIIGNGDQSQLFNSPGALKPSGNIVADPSGMKSPGAPVHRPGIKLTCNLPPFPVKGAYATCMVDFKMMLSLAKGEIEVPGEWILGFRPKHFMQKHPAIYMKRAAQIKEFFIDKPGYVKNYTDFNCGHMATYYAIKRLKADEINLYGFDSIFDMNLRSSSDFYQNSNRDANSNIRLNNNWRPIWQNMFNEFHNIKFILHHIHNNIKFPVRENVEIQTYVPPKMKIEKIKSNT